jgi:hypothetical protein
MAQDPLAAKSTGQPAWKKDFIQGMFFVIRFAPCRNYFPFGSPPEFEIMARHAFSHFRHSSAQRCMILSSRPACSQAFAHCAQASAHDPQMRVAIGP